mgnify:CR=1 FL=1
MKKLSLKYCRRILNSLPENSAIKSEMTIIYNRIVSNLNESRNKHANQDYYRPKLDNLFGIFKNGTKQIIRNKRIQ